MTPAVSHYSQSHTVRNMDFMYLGSCVILDFTHIFISPTSSAIRTLNFPGIHIYMSSTQFLNYILKLSTNSPTNVLFKNVKFGGGGNE